MHQRNRKYTRARYLQKRISCVLRNFLSGCNATREFLAVKRRLRPVRNSHADLLVPPSERAPSMRVARCGSARECDRANSRGGSPGRAAGSLCSRGVFISIKTGVRARTFARPIRERNASPEISLVKRPGFYPGPLTLRCTPRIKMAWRAAYNFAYRAYDFRGIGLLSLRVSYFILYCPNHAIDERSEETTCKIIRLRENRMESALKGIRCESR